MKTFDFKPKMFSAIKNYNKQTFMADLMAGVIVGIKTDLISSGIM